MSQGNESALVLLSGGLDSVTLLYMCHKKYQNIHVITYHYGQKNNRELESALYFADGLNVTHSLIDLRDLQMVFGEAALIDNPNSEEIPDISGAITTTQATLNKTIVPFRNAIFLSIATAYCISNNIDTILYGAHANDSQTYLDCRPKFINAFEKVIQAAGHDIKVEAPFITYNRAKIVKIASMYGVPLERTYSCYRGTEKHCGQCPTCIERKNAFKESGVTDVTDYSQ